MFGRREGDSAGEPQRFGGSGVGPYDAPDAPADDIQRLDLGSLLLPTIADLEVQMQAMDDGQIAAVVVANATSALQIGVYAAPRSEGIWGEVRAEIAESVTADGGKSEEIDGPYGTELLAHVSTPDGPAQLRFMGIDGSRWFLRGLFQGQAVLDADAAEPFLEVIRNIVVVRDKEARPVREPLPLRLPKEFAAEAARQQAAQAEAAAQAGGEGATGQLAQPAHRMGRTDRTDRRRVRSLADALRLVRAVNSEPWPVCT